MPISSYQNSHKLIAEHTVHNQNGHHNKIINNEHHHHNEDASDNDQTDFNSDLPHDALITGNKFPSSIDQTIDTNGKTEPINCGETFAYKTLNGDVIRSVHPPGKGKAHNYKVSKMLTFLRFSIFVSFSLSNCCMKSVNKFSCLF